jgi:hypothetical protein
VEDRGQVSNQNQTVWERIVLLEQERVYSTNAANVQQKFSAKNEKSLETKKLVGQFEPNRRR